MFLSILGDTIFFRYLYQALGYSPKIHIYFHGYSNLRIEIQNRFNHFLVQITILNFKIKEKFILNYFIFNKSFRTSISSRCLLFLL